LSGRERPFVQLSRHESDRDDAILALVSGDRELFEQVAELEAQVADLRRDVARLWLAYGSHERRLLGGDPAQSDASGDPGAVGGRLADLDDVLAAIERATEALESAYEDEAGAETDREA
jgi:hypothetical protein